jgi:hypothetical protein
MILTSEPSMNQKGEPVLNRITWTPDRKGRVRQLWETSNNLGESWTVVFDGLYYRR